MQAADGKELKGVEDIRVGLQELGVSSSCSGRARLHPHPSRKVYSILPSYADSGVQPRCTLKLRRVDKGIGRAGSEGEDALSWEWKAKMEKKRTRFNL